MTAKMRFPWLAAALALTPCALSPLSAAAHDFWLQPQAFAVAPGGTLSMMILVGHGKDRQKSLMTADRVTLFAAQTAHGLVDRRGELRLGDANTDSLLHFPTPGVQVLAFTTNGTYSELPGLRFTDYIKAEGLTAAIDLRNRTHQSDAPGREVYSRRAKALIQVGKYTKADDAVVTKPVGLSLEIVPDLNPYAPTFNGTLPVHIYYLGQPLAGATVMLNNLDFDGRPVATKLTDAQGRTTLSVPKVGEWQLNVVWTRVITGDPKADFETTFSSLSLGYGPAK